MRLRRRLGPRPSAGAFFLQGWSVSRSLSASSAAVPDAALPPPSLESCLPRHFPLPCGSRERLFHRGLTLPLNAAASFSSRVLPDARAFSLSRPTSLLVSSPALPVGPACRC